MYATIFIVVAGWYLYHRLSFTQIAPVFFVPKPDITGHFIFATGLQQALVVHSWLRLLFDVLFYSLTPLLICCFIKKRKLTIALAWLSFIFNIFYCYLLSCMSFVSKEPFIAWMLFPLMFTGFQTKGFYFKLHILRILFILFFATAGLWKLRGGGAFNVEQFSGILLHQYATVLSSGEAGWFVQLIKYLINHTLLSFVLYWLVILAELLFLIGLFTKKYDKLLLWILIGFIVFDYFLMEINYFSWLPFSLLFYFSKYSIPDLKEE